MQKDYEITITKLGQAIASRTVAPVFMFVRNDEETARLDADAYLARERARLTPTPSIA